MSFIQEQINIFLKKTTEITVVQNGFFFIPLMVAELLMILPRLFVCFSCSSQVFFSPLLWVTHRFFSVLWAASNPLLIIPGVGVVFSTFTPGCVVLLPCAWGRRSTSLAPHLCGWVYAGYPTGYSCYYLCILVQFSRSVKVLGSSMLKWWNLRITWTLNRLKKRANKAGWSTKETHTHPLRSIHFSLWK